MNCWLRLASSAQKICNSIFCGSRGELPSTHCAFLGQFCNTSQYLTILHNTSQYYHSTSSVNSATINQTLRLSRTLEKGPPTTTTNKEPCISNCNITFLPAGPFKGHWWIDDFWPFRCTLSILLILQKALLQLLYFQSFRCDHLWPYLGEGAVFLSKYFGGDIFDNFGEIAIGGNPKQILAPCLTDALR